MPDAWKNGEALIDGLKSLPFDGVSLAYRTLWLSDREVEVRRSNPVFSPTFTLPETARPGERIELPFEVEVAGSDTEAFGYSLSGGFGAISARVFEGQVSLDWYAPEELSEAEDSKLWVVFQDEEGGSAVWTGTLGVSPEGS